MRPRDGADYDRLWTVSVQYPGKLTPSATQNDHQWRCESAQRGIYGSSGQESSVFEERSCCEAPPFEGVYRGKWESHREPHLGVMLEDAVPHQAIEIPKDGA